MVKTNQSPNLRLLLSLGYWFSAHSLGLLLHPYQSLRRLVRDEFYRPLVYLPSVTLFLWWFTGVILARFNVLATLRLSLIARALNIISMKQVLFSFIFVWGVVFLLSWQVFLLYLYLRFKQVRGHKHD